MRRRERAWLTGTLLGAALFIAGVAGDRPLVISAVLALAVPVVLGRLRYQERRHPRRRTPLLLTSISVGLFIAWWATGRFSWAFATGLLVAALILFSERDR